MDRIHFRQPHKYWLACATEWGAPLLRSVRSGLVRQPHKPRDRWRDVVLLGADHIGDVLYRTIGLAELKIALPECRLHFVASQPAANLLENHPAIDSVLIAPQPIDARSLGEVVALLKVNTPDAVFCYDTGDYWRDQLATAVAGVAHCVGYTHKGFSGFVTDPVPIRTPQPFAAYFRDFVEYLSGRKVDSLRPQVFLTDGQRSKARQMRGELAGGVGPLLVASMTSRQRSHLAIQRRMAETLAELRRRVAVTVVLLGAGGDEEFLQMLAREAGLDCQVVAGQLGVAEAVALFELANVAFCLDSGPRHMANAAGVPVVFCRNLEFLKIEAGKYLDTETDVAPDVELVSYAPGNSPPLFEMETALQALLKHLW